MRSLFLGAALAVALSTPALAVTITESTDFSGNLANPTNLGLLDLGANSISGVVLATCLAVASHVEDCGIFSGDDGDAVAFDIGAGLQLSAATLTIPGVSSREGTDPGVFASSFTSLRFLGALDNGVFDLLSGSPLTGTQNYGVSPLMMVGLEGAPISFNWRLDLTVTAAAPVSAVPLPAGMPLLLVGLGGLAVLRRRSPRA